MKSKKKKKINKRLLQNIIKDYKLIKKQFVKKDDIIYK